LNLTKKSFDLLTWYLLGEISKTKWIPGEVLVLIANLFSVLTGKKVRFKFQREKLKFEAREGSQCCYFLDPQRGFWLYRNGIETRWQFIKNGYCLNKVHCYQSDTVVDCGANSGDLYQSLKNHIKAENYIGIEPNPPDFKVLSLNLSADSTLLNKAIGPVEGEFPFFVGTSSGDSKLIEPSSYESVISVEVVRLDKLLFELGNPKKVKLLKLKSMVLSQRCCNLWARV
jgi:FkbM family methyltransferase